MLNEGWDSSKIETEIYAHMKQIYDIMKESGMSKPLYLSACIIEDDENGTYIEVNNNHWEKPEEEKIDKDNIF